MRIVLDTNILVSGLISSAGPPGQILAALQRRAFVLITSKAQLDELKRVLGYPKLRARISVPQAEALLATIEAIAEKVEGALPIIRLSADAADNAILATAVAGGADLIVSGDGRHLLALRSVEEIPIVSARNAVDRLPT